MLWDVWWEDASGDLHKETWQCDHPYVMAEAMVGQTYDGRVFVRLEAYRLNGDDPNRVRA